MWQIARNLFSHSKKIFDKIGGRIRLSMHLIFDKMKNQFQFRLR